MSVTAHLDAILPAGGRLKPDFAEKVGTDVKALIKIDGKPLLEHVLDAIAESGAVRRTVLIGGAAVRAAYGDRATLCLDEAESGPANMYNGLEALMAEEEPPTRVLLTTTDLPYVRAEHVRLFVDVAPPHAQIAVPLVRRADFDQEYPGTTSTFVQLKDGQFTLGGMFLMDTAAMGRMRAHVNAVFEQRKSKLGMARLLGLPFVVRYFTHTLSLTDVERKIVGLLNCDGRAVPGVPAQFAYDIDDWEDYSYAAGRQANG